MKYRFFLLLTFIGLAANAQKKWTLEECVTYAVENNLTVKQFMLDYDSAEIDKSDAIGSLLPTINGSLSASSNTGFSINPTTNLPSNETQNNVNGSVSSNLTLFDGLRNIKRVQRAKMNQIANQYRLEDFKDDIRLNVANAYLQIVSNKEQVKVFKAQYKATEQDLNRTKELVESGVLPKGDLLEIEATAASQEQQIINGEGQVTIAKVNLAQLLQITDYENFDIADDDFNVPPSDILDNSAKTIFAKALEFRNDIKLSKTNIELAEKDYEIAKGAYLPTLGAFFQYGTRYSDVTQIPDPNGVFFTPSFTDQLWIFDGFSYGAQISVPIFNGWSTRNNVKRSKIGLERSKLQFERDKLALEADIQQAHVNVSASAKAYEAAQKTVEARQLANEYAKERYDVGLINAFDYQQSQARLDNATASLIQTKYNYIFQLKILEFYFGIPIKLN